MLIKIKSIYTNGPRLPLLRMSSLCPPGAATADQPLPIPAPQDGPAGRPSDGLQTVQERAFGPFLKRTKKPKREKIIKGERGKRKVWK